MKNSWMILGWVLALAVGGFGCGEGDESLNAGQVTTTSTIVELGPVCISVVTPTLTVKVTDTAGNILRDATVIFEANGGNEHLKEFGDTYIGVHNDKQVDPGTYTLTTAKRGYKSDVRPIVGKKESCWTKFEPETVVLKAE